MNRKLYRALTATVALLLFAVLLLTDGLYHADMLLSDGVYRRLESRTRDIKIITIDEKTEAAWGKFDHWSREKAAALTELLSADPETAPAVLAFDIMFIGEADPATDARLAEACRRAGNVVCASNLQYADVVRDGYVYPDEIVGEERPYDALDAVTRVGFANNCISEDNIVRYAQLTADCGGETLQSLAYTAYAAYAERTGRPVEMPATGGGQTGFFYSGLPGDIPHVSLVDVLEGRVPVSEFDDCLVFVGVYASGFQDAYLTSVARGQQMYGVEINANIVLALLNGKLATPVSVWLYGAVAGLLLAVFVFFMHRQRLWAVILEAVVLIGAHLLAGRLLAGNGHLIPQVYFMAVVLCSLVLFIVQKYVVERIRRRQALNTMKKYVAPQIVDKLSKDGGFELRLGGEKKHIAVLFVDVRGFTTMSESLPPEDVVRILNRYLAVTTRAVFANEGTLDKFIGDATMAVFNAPFDLDDYIFRAVKTAWDIREGVATLAKDFEAEYHRTVHVGIGVNCGEAVVGNIGCDVRMDYTAIGDTVNTAARLESNAPAGKILISQAVYDAVRDRVTADPIGELTLKGKNEKVPVFSVTGFKDSKEAESI